MHTPNLGAENINVLSDSGQVELYFCYGDKKSGDDSEEIWEACAEIKNVDVPIG